MSLCDREGSIETAVTERKKLSYRIQNNHWAHALSLLGLMMNNLELHSNHAAIKKNRL